MSMAQQREINELKRTLDLHRKRLDDIEERLGKVEAKRPPGRPPKEAANA